MANSASIPSAALIATRLAPNGLNPEHIDRASQSLVKVCVGERFGSGMVITEHGHILTTAHIFRNLSKGDLANINVWIKLPRLKTQPSDTELVQCRAIIRKSNIQRDVALLQVVLPNDGGCRRRRCRCVPIDLKASFQACKHLRPRERVVVFGHALFGHHFEQYRPSLAVGNLSKIVKFSNKKRPAILQSNAAVQAGEMYTRTHISSQPDPFSARL